MADNKLSHKILMGYNNNPKKLFLNKILNFEFREYKLVTTISYLYFVGQQ